MRKASADEFVLAWVHPLSSTGLTPLFTSDPYCCNGLAYLPVGYMIVGSPRCLMEVAATSAFRYATPEALGRALSDIGSKNFSHLHEKVTIVIEAHKATWQWSEVDVAEALLQVLPVEKKVLARRAVPEELSEQPKTVWADLVALSAAASERATVVAADSGVVVGDSADFEVTPAFCEALQLARTGSGCKREAPSRASGANQKTRSQPSNKFGHLANGVGTLLLESDEEFLPAVCPGNSAVEVLVFADGELAVDIVVEDIVPHCASAVEAFVSADDEWAVDLAVEACPLAIQDIPPEAVQDLAMEVPAPPSTGGLAVVACPSAVEGAALLESVVDSAMGVDSVPIAPTGASTIVKATTTGDSVGDLEIKGPNSMGYIMEATSQRRSARITSKFGTSVALTCYVIGIVPSQCRSGCCQECSS